MCTAGGRMVRSRPGFRTGGMPGIRATKEQDLRVAENSNYLPASSGGTTADVCRPPCTSGSLSYTSTCTRLWMPSM